MIRLSTDPPMGDVLELYRATGKSKPWMTKAAILQCARSEKLAFYDGDRLIGCAMFYPAPACTELIFVCLPEASRHMLAIVRAARLTARHLPQDGTVRARCMRSNIAGRRFTWLCGLRPAGIDGGAKVYELRRRS